MKRAEHARRRAAFARRARERLPPAALIALLFAPPIAAAEPGPDVGWIDRAALAAGEVQVLAEREPRHGPVRVKAAVAIDAPAEDIWRVLKACDVAPEYVPNVVSCRSVAVLEDGRAELFSQTVKPAFFLPAFEHVFRLDYEPYTHIGVHEVSGPIEKLDGAWWLVPAPGGSMWLIHELELAPGMPVPRLFVRGELKRDLPKILSAVRDRAEAARH